MPNLQRPPVNTYSVVLSRRTTGGINFGEDDRSNATADAIRTIGNDAFLNRSNGPAEKVLYCGNGCTRVSPSFGERPSAALKLAREHAPLPGLAAAASDRPLWATTAEKLFRGHSSSALAKKDRRPLRPGPRGRSRKNLICHDTKRLQPESVAPTCQGYEALLIASRLRDLCKMTQTGHRYNLSILCIMRD
jgi:hypothetical protein